MSATLPILADLADADHAWNRLKIARQAREHAERLLDARRFDERLATEALLASLHSLIAKI